MLIMKLVRYDCSKTGSAVAYIAIVLQSELYSDDPYTFAHACSVTFCVHGGGLGGHFSAVFSAVSAPCNVTYLTLPYLRGGQVVTPAQR